MNIYFKTLLYSLSGIVLSLSTATGEEDRAVFFNGENLDGWSGDEAYWSVRDGAIVGHSDEPVVGNKFIWSEVPVSDFRLSVDVKLMPEKRNAGIQFRSVAVNRRGQAKGYQADAGWGLWGKLYHEHGRRKLDWNDRGLEAVKHGDWNRYEILAVGDRIWTALNGKLCVAIKDPKGERTGQIAFQIHGGPPQTVHYRNPTLTHNPKVELAGLNEAELNAELKAPDDVDAKPAESPPSAGTKPSLKPLHSTTGGKKGKPDWPKRIAAVDPGSRGEAWAKPTFDDTTWKTMKLPGHFEKAGLPGFNGVVWFRKTITLTADQAAARASLHLGQIDDMDVTWMNGKRVGGFEAPGHHYTVRNYPVPEGVLREGRNTIAVRVMDHGSSGGIAGELNQLSLRLGNESISLANEWRFAPGADLATLTGSPKTSVPGSPITSVPKSRPNETFPTDLAEVPLPQKAPQFGDRFALEDGDVVAFLGGGAMVKQVESGHLESLLTHSARGQKVLFRDMSWQADTVYQRQRPRNFGSQASMLGRIGGTVIVAAFGRMEAMDSEEKLPEFVQAYESLLEQFVPRTEKIVLITPHPFVGNKQPHSPDLTRHNDAVRAYAAAIRGLAKKRGWVAVDMSRFDADGLSIDGLQLTPEGHTAWAKSVARQLAGDTASVLPSGWEAVHQQIRKKNDLWRRFRRPTNWGFVYGNLQRVPSSHDHRPGYPRWFPKEVAAILPLVEESETRIFEVQTKTR